MCSISILHQSFFAIQKEIVKKVKIRSSLKLQDVGYNVSGVRGKPVST